MADIETKPTITITQEEYKELLLKAEGANKDHMIADAIRSLVVAQGKLVEPGSYDEDAHGVQIRYSNAFVKDVLNVLAIIDTDKYKHMTTAMALNAELKKTLAELKKKKAEEEKKEEAE